MLRHVLILTVAIGAVTSSQHRFALPVQFSFRTVHNPHQAFQAPPTVFHSAPPRVFHTASRLAVPRSSPVRSPSPAKSISSHGGRSFRRFSHSRFGSGAPVTPPAALIPVRVTSQRVPTRKVPQKKLEVETPVTTPAAEVASSTDSHMPVMVHVPLDFEGDSVVATPEQVAELNLSTVNGTVVAEMPQSQKEEFFTGNEDELIEVTTFEPEPTTVEPELEAATDQTSAPSLASIDTAFTLEPPKETPAELPDAESDSQGKSVFIQIPTTTSIPPIFSTVQPEQSLPVDAFSPSGSHSFVQHQHQIPTTTSIPHTPSTVQSEKSLPFKAFSFSGAPRFIQQQQKTPTTTSVPPIPSTVQPEQSLPSNEFSFSGAPTFIQQQQTIPTTTSVPPSSSTVQPEQSLPSNEFSLSGAPSLVHQQHQPSLFVQDPNGLVQQQPQTSLLGQDPVRQAFKEFITWLRLASKNLNRPELLRLIGGEEENAQPQVEIEQQPRRKTSRLFARQGIHSSVIVGNSIGKDISSRVTSGANALTNNDDESTRVNTKTAEVSDMSLTDVLDDSSIKIIVDDSADYFVVESTTPLPEENEFSDRMTEATDAATTTLPEVSLTEVQASTLTSSTTSEPLIKVPAILQPVPRRTSRGRVAGVKFSFPRSF